MSRGLAHIVFLTAQSSMIKEMYGDEKLRDISQFFLIEHLVKSDIQYRLGTQESCPQEMIDYIREHFGGSVWEIWQAFVDYKNNGDYKTITETMIQDEYAKIFDYRFNLSDKSCKPLFDRVSTVIAKEGKYKASLETDEGLSILIKIFVDIDIWFYDPRTQTLTANSQSVRKAFQKMYLSVK